MRILIAPDKFKGCLSAPEVARHIAAGLRAALPHAKIDLLPLADGGEGTADVICRALHGSWLSCHAHDPLGRAITCRYAFVAQPKLAIIEMSEAAGLWRLQPNECDVEHANTFGVGEMLFDAARRGAKKIVVGLGGSATNDGGFGLARALGFKFFAGEKELSGGVVTDLLKLTHIEPPSLVRQLPDPPLPKKGKGRSKAHSNGPRTASATSTLLPAILAVADVRNPLLGKAGATRVFGPQKSASPEQVARLERALRRLADVVADKFGRDYRREAGAGAAGGLGFGLMSFCGAKMRRGFDVVAETVGLEAKIKEADLVVTGEGSLDAQTLQGKTPAGVAAMARNLEKPVYAIVGRVTERAARELFQRIYSTSVPGISEKTSITRAGMLLEERARELANDLQKTGRVRPGRSQA